MYYVLGDKVKIILHFPCLSYTYNWMVYADKNNRSKQIKYKQKINIIKVKEHLYRLQLRHLKFI